MFTKFLFLLINLFLCTCIVFLSSPLQHNHTPPLSFFNLKYKWFQFSSVFLQLNFLYPYFYNFHYFKVNFPRFFCKNFPSQFELLLFWSLNLIMIPIPVQLLDIILAFSANLISLSFLSSKLSSFPKLCICFGENQKKLSSFIAWA